MNIRGLIVFFALTLATGLPVYAMKPVKEPAVAAEARQKPPGKAKRAKVKEEAAHQLLKMDARADTVSTRLILAFDAGVPNFEVESSQVNKVHVFTIKLYNTDYGGLELPEIEGPINHVEATHARESEVRINVYLHQLLKHRIEKKKNQMKFEFLPGTALPEELWPSRLEKLSYESMGPFNLSMHAVFDDLPSDKRVFLTLDRKKAIVVLKNTSLASGRTPSPVVPFIKDFKAVEGVTKIGIPYYKLEFTSQSNLAFAIKEDELKLKIELQKEALMKEHGPVNKEPARPAPNSKF